MNTFTKSIFLMLAAGSASAHKVGPGALRAQIDDADAANVKDPPSGCVPNERPQTQSSTATKTRFRWTYQGEGECEDEDFLTFEWGVFDDINDSNECAE